MKKIHYTVIATNAAILGILATIRLVTNYEVVSSDFSPGILSLAIILGSYGFGYIAPQFPIFALFEWQRQREKWQREILVALSPALAVLGVLIAVFGLLGSSEMFYVGLLVFNFNAAYHISVETNGLPYSK